MLIKKVLRNLIWNYEMGKFTGGSCVFLYLLRAEDILVGPHNFKGLRFGFKVEVRIDFRVKRSSQRQK